MKVLSAVLLVTMLSACGESAPDLRWLYRDAVLSPSQPPVVIIPGILGTRLINNTNGVEVWPGSLSTLLFSRYDQLSLSFDDEKLQPLPDPLLPDGLFDHAGGQDFYGQILHTLEQAGGYLPGNPGASVEDALPRFYVLSYDWRQDNVKSAQALDDLINQIREDYGDPDLKVDIIAHSMGGLIARYFLRYGSEDVLVNNDFPVNNDGVEKVRRLVLLGTPNLGSISAIISVFEGRPIGFRRIPPDVMMTMPSVYQLFPHALTDWLITAEGESLRRDQFDAYIWQRFEIGPWDKNVAQSIKAKAASDEDGERRLNLMRQYFTHQLERARRFTWALTVPSQAERLVEIQLFGGDCAPTPARLLVEEVEGESVLRLWPDQVVSANSNLDYKRLMLEPGDGAVTKASLLSRNVLSPAVPRHRYIDFPARGGFFLCEDHEHLSGNVNFQDNLLHFLLSAD